MTTEPGASGAVPSGPATGSGGGGGTATRSGTSGLTASDVGVTPTAIRIGVWVPDIGAIAKIPGLGDTGFDPATYRAAYDAFASELNAQGGVLGRKIELVYYTMDATNEADSNQQGCIFFSQQEKVFALFTASVGYESSFDCVHRATGAITYSTLGFEQHYYGGNWLVTQDAATNRVLRNLVAFFDGRGELRGKRIALVEQARLKTYSDQIVLPALKALGYDVVHRATMSDDTGQLGSQIPVEVNQMKAKGVEVALTLLNPAAAGLLIQNADQQLFHPRWLFSDFNAGTDDLGPRLFPANTDAAGLTSLRTGEFRTGGPEPAYDASCAARYNARTTGKKVRFGVTKQDNPYRYALYGCTAFDRFRAAALAAGPTLTHARWMAAIAAMGSVHIAFAADGTYGAGKTDAADLFRMVEFHASCAPDGNNCWLPSGEFTRPG